jgi:hypothetical protein
MNKRRFVKKGNKTQIIKQSTQTGKQIAHAKMDSIEGEIFRLDMSIFLYKKCCAFIRPYIKDEYQGFQFPDHLDLNEITHTFVICDPTEEHVLKHVKPIGTTYKAVVMDCLQGNDRPIHARIPLLPEQKEVLQQFYENHGEIL